MIKANPIPTYPAMVAAAVAVVLSSTGNHKTDVRGAAARLMEPAAPTDCVPITVSLTEIDSSFRKHQPIIIELFIVLPNASFIIEDIPGKYILKLIIEF